MRRTLALLMRICALLLLAGACNRFNPSNPPVFVPGDPSIGEEGVGVSSQVQVDSPLFGGITDMLAGESWVKIAWRAASDDIDASADLRYRVYLASGPGDEDFTQPVVETAPGELEAIITGLPAGLPIYAIVRAVDTEGNEDGNLVEWIAQPDPVLYIDSSSSAGASADGLTPATAFPSINAAVIATISSGHRNFYVAGGVYFENVFLFESMFVYGGFPPGFDIAARDPVAHVTEIRTTFGVDLITIPSSAGLVGVDGVVLSGDNTALTGVKAQDALLRISNCEVRDTTIHGLDLQSGYVTGNLLKGFVRGCTISGSLGEGITVFGLVDLVIDNNRIRDNANEGIESQWIFGSIFEDDRIEITRNRIDRNGDDGIDLDFAELSETDPSLSQGARIRVVIRGNLIRDNGLEGVLLDMDFENEDGIDFRARIEDNRISSHGLHGIRFDGDAGGALRLARNVISANRLGGFVASGTCDGPWLRISHCRILGNGGPAVQVSQQADVELRHCLLAHNAGPAILAPRAYLDASNSFFIENAESTTFATRIRYCLFHGEAPPAQAGPGVLTGSAGLENQPLAVARATGAGTGALFPMTVTPTWQVGDLVEVRDDGVPRVIVAVEPAGVVLDPPADPPASAGDVIFDFAGGESVDEREGLLIGSPGIDGGDPIEVDRDDSRSDLGPIGGNTPGNVGIETALPPERAPLEIVRLAPSASELTTGNTFEIRFNRVLPAGFVDTVQVAVDGVAAPGAAVAAVDNRLIVGPVPGASPGSTVHVEIEPSGFVVSGAVQAPPPYESSSAPASLLPAGAGPGDSVEFQPLHIVLEYRSAEAVQDGDATGSPNDTIGSAQLLPTLPAVASGVIGAPGDQDHWRVELAPGETLWTNVCAGRAGSALLPRITLLRAGTGEVLASDSALLPSPLDPTLPPFTAASAESLVLRIESASGAGSPGRFYELGIEVR